MSHQEFSCYVILCHGYYIFLAFTLRPTVSHSHFMSNKGTTEKSLLFTSVAKDLKLRFSVKQIQLAIRVRLELGSSGLQVQHSNSSATLPPLFNNKHFVDETDSSIFLLVFKVPKTTILAILHEYMYHANGWVLDDFYKTKIMCYASQ